MLRHLLLLALRIAALCLLALAVARPTITASGIRIEREAPVAAAFGGGREAVVARELTKLFETVLGETLDELIEKVAADENQRKGEFVIVVRGCEDDTQARLLEGQRLYAKLVEHLKPSLAAKLAADISGAPRKALYGGGE